jgi:DNA-binding transcriptional regulator GbsR (MarR family)
MLQPTQNRPALAPYEEEIIQMVVRLGRMLGMPRSIGEIYGLLFASVKPLSMECIAQRLGLSIGSASQGLKTLKSLGAVRASQIPGDRKEHFVAVLNFREIVTRFLQDELRPQLADVEAKVESIGIHLESLPAESRQEMLTRLDVVRKLNARARQLVPAVSTILSL